MIQGIRLHFVKIVIKLEQVCPNLITVRQDYGFALLGGMALALFAYYTAGFDVGMGRRRMQLFMAMAAVYLLAAELATTGYPWLLLGGIVWAMTDICTLTPKPKPEPEEREEKET